MEPSPSDLSLAAGLPNLNMKLSKTKSILVIVVKWWDRGPSTSVAHSVRVSVAVNLIPVCQSKDNKLEHVLSFFRTCSEFHLSGCHYKTFHSPKGTNTDLFHTLLALRSTFFPLSQLFLCYRASRRKTENLCWRGLWIQRNRYARDDACSWLLSRAITHW